MDKPFNVRVYGIIINKNNEILLSDEKKGKYKFTKFPGGGLEFGEGTVDCLKREFKEELGAELDEIDHYYTTDFFQQSAFNSKHQVLSIYYTACLKDDFELPVSKPNDELFEYEIFRWVKLSEIEDCDVTFPIDKLVLRKLLESKELKA